MAKADLFWSNEMKKLYKALSILALPLVSACMPSMDLQGTDPDAYYRQHPIESKVATKNFVQVIRFEKNATTPSAGELDKLENELEQVRPKGAEEIIIKVSPADGKRSARAEYLKQYLNSLGYSLPVRVEKYNKLGAESAAIIIRHAAVVLPDCPDWKKSPVTTYSNGVAANYGCASAVNLGLMIDDPHDLVRGKDSRKSRVERAGKALSDYNSGATQAPTMSTSTTAQ